MNKLIHNTLQKKKKKTQQKHNKPLSKTCYSLQKWKQHFKAKHKLRTIALLFYQLYQLNIKIACKSYPAYTLKPS